VSTPRKSKKPIFEESLAELERLVDSMEVGDLPLEESLQSFQRGVELFRSCQQALQEAEQKVQILSARTTDAEPENFAPDE